LEASLGIAIVKSVYDSWRSKEGGSAELPPWTFGRQTLACLGAWLTESLGGSPEGQRSPGRLDVLQEGNLKGAGAGHPHVLKHELEGKKTRLSEQRALARTQKKRRV